VEKKMKEKNQSKKKNPKSEPSTPSGKLVVLPYVKGLSEATARILKKYDRTVAFKPANTIGQQLFKLKDKADHLKMSDAVYKVGCKNCDKCYIGETTRPLYIRQKEHQAEAEKATNTRSFTRQQRKDSNTTDYKSALAEHTATTNHVIDWDGVKTLERVPDWHMRGIKEAIYIRQNPNNLNRPQGERHLLPNVWNSLLSPGQVRPDSHRGSSRGRGGQAGGGRK
jgi:hypothetical protein